MASNTKRRSFSTKQAVWKALPLVHWLGDVNMAYCGGLGICYHSVRNAMIGETLKRAFWGAATMFSHQSHCLILFIPLFVPVPNSPALSERDSSATRWRGLSLVCQFHHVEIARVEIKHCGFTMWVDLDDDPSCSELHMPGTPSLSLGNVEFPDRLLYILEEVVRFTNKTGDWSCI